VKGQFSEEAKAAEAKANAAADTKAKVASEAKAKAAAAAKAAAEAKAADAKAAEAKAAAEPDEVQVEQTAIVPFRERLHAGRLKQLETTETPLLKRRGRSETPSRHESRLNVTTNPDPKANVAL
jgi:hypothetical protein